MAPSLRWNFEQTSFVRRGLPDRATPMRMLCPQCLFCDVAYPDLPPGGFRIIRRTNARWCGRCDPLNFSGRDAPSRDGIPTRPAAFRKTLTRCACGVSPQSEWRDASKRLVCFGCSVRDHQVEL